jgi:urate oxidase
MTVPAALGPNSYGKHSIRLVKVVRGERRHDLRDLTVDVALGGDLEPTYVDGDNSGVLATDTMRNTVYALAREHQLADVETFGLALVDHLLTTPRTRHARVRLVEHGWDRIRVDGRGHEHAFTRATGGERTATVTGGGDDRQVIAGIAGLSVLRTAGSGWSGFLRDRYTTLPETDDRILATVVEADWSYRDTGVDFGRCWDGVREQLLTSFTDHYSPSVQHTIYHMGEAVLDRFPEVERIHLSLPNRHHLLVDLSPFGLDNPNEVFVATEEPYGLIEATVERVPEARAWEAAPGESAAPTGTDGPGAQGRGARRTTG